MEKPFGTNLVSAQALNGSVHETGRDVDVLEAYERLIHDAMSGDRTLFTAAEGIERLWEVSMPLLEAPTDVQTYVRVPGVPGRCASSSPRAPGGCRSSAPRASPSEVAEHLDQAGIATLSDSARAPQQVSIRRRVTT
jgi:Glucose-6-phosphate dehydrogenase, C-terminal domain